MTRTEPLSHRIFSEWSLYRKVVENDYMAHTAIAQAVERALGEVPDAPSVLDLGCGDAEVVSRLAEVRSIGTYFGVDQSGAAIDSARARLERLLPGLDFKQENLLEFVRTTPLRFDVILCGYTLHHLSTEEKRDFFRFVRRVLNRGGMLMAYDAFRPPSESRRDYLEAYIAWIAEEWDAIHPEEHEAIASHMRAEDKPETLDVFCQLAQDAGLRPTRTPEWSCERNYHHLIRITH
ncbi:MAG: class I SAM-dependent methyltransferase [Myxococcota bacterium]